MWKCFSRRSKDNFEKGLKYNHFEKCCGVVNANNNPCDEKKWSCPLSRWRSSKTSWGSRENRNGTNNRRWNEQINQRWTGVVTWSSALVLGWYAHQIINLAQKYQCRKKLNKTALNNLITILYPYANGVNKEALSINTNSRLESIINNFSPTIHVISNEQNVQTNKSSSSDSSESSLNSSSSDLSDVLNSIENKLGLAAIENGQYQDGLNLLRSAANRQHAPALYNLGLCYEMGLGVTIDEKMAMEFYKSAASLEHPGALYNLAIYYGQGRGGLHRNLETATRLLRLAAIQGQEDAAEALKTLNLDKREPQRDIETEMWKFPHNDCIAPTHSALFVDNASFFKTQNGEAIVF